MRRGGSYLGDKPQCYNHSVPGGMSDGIAGRSQPIIGNVQALRAIAALMVATMHAFAVQAYQQPGNGMLHLLHTAAQIGHAGVDIFFVISGFIITTVARRVAQDAKPGLNPSLAGIFALHRAARIYPLYWIVLFVVLLRPDRRQTS